MRQFRKAPQGLGRFFPVALKAACSVPTPVSGRVGGRVELTIGRLGAGKTTWSSLRAKRLARATDRPLYTTGIDWPDPWNMITCYQDLEDLRDAVLVIDEVHLLMPSAKGLHGRDEEKFWIRFNSLLRKRHIDVVATTQAWTRVATHLRQIVTTVWVCEPISHGRLHVATAHDQPDDGGAQMLPVQYFGPRAARIPTDAEVWLGYPRQGELQAIFDQATGDAGGEADGSPLASARLSDAEWHELEQTFEPGNTW